VLSVESFRIDGVEEEATLRDAISLPCFYALDIQK